MRQYRTRLTESMLAEQSAEDLKSFKSDKPTLRTHFTSSDAAALFHTSTSWAYRQAILESHTVRCKVEGFVISVCTTERSIDRNRGGNSTHATRMSDRSKRTRHGSKSPLKMIDLQHATRGEDRRLLQPAPEAEHYNLKCSPLSQRKQRDGGDAKVQQVFELSEKFYVAEAKAEGGPKETSFDPTIARVPIHAESSSELDDELAYEAYLQRAEQHGCQSTAKAGRGVGERTGQKGEEEIREIAQRILLKLSQEIGLKTPPKSSRLDAGRDGWTPRIDSKVLLYSTEESDGECRDFEDGCWKDGDVKDCDSEFQMLASALEEVESSDILLEGQDQSRTQASSNVSTLKRGTGDCTQARVQGVFVHRRAVRDAQYDGGAMLSEPDLFAEDYIQSYTDGAGSEGDCEDSDEDDVDAESLYSNNSDQEELRAESPCVRRSVSPADCNSSDQACFLGIGFKVRFSWCIHRKLQSWPLRLVFLANEFTNLRRESHTVAACHCQCG